MNIVLPGILASLLYLASATLQVMSLRHGTSQRTLVLTLGSIGLILHGASLVQQIYTQAGVNLALLPMISLMFLSVGAMVILSSLRRPIENLLIVPFPLAAVAIVASLIFKDTYAPLATLSHGFVAHIILSIIAYSLLTIAALQALLLAFGDYELRHRRLAVMRALPPLQTMEGLLFELLWGGLIFLSASIGTGFFYLGNREAMAPGLMHHTIITLGAWVVFAVLLWGRYQLGWRGQIASRWTLAGFALLVLGYFGSKFVLEVVLGRI